MQLLPLLEVWKWWWCVLCLFSLYLLIFHILLAIQVHLSVKDWRGENNTKMPPSQLQPVLKMKVDEFFFIWLSDPSIQSLLKDYLDLIKSGEHLDLDKGDGPDKKSLTFNENNNVASQKKLAEERPFPTGILSNPSPTSALPSGSSCNTRMTGPNGRVLRKSVSTRKVITQ